MTREEFIMKYLTGDVAQAMAALERVQGAARTQLADYVAEHTLLPVVSAAKVALLTERNMPADVPKGNIVVVNGAVFSTVRAKPLDVQFWGSPVMQGVNKDWKNNTFVRLPNDMYAIAVYLPDGEWTEQAATSLDTVAAKYPTGEDFLAAMETSIRDLVIAPSTAATEQDVREGKLTQFSTSRRYAAFSKLLGLSDLYEGAVQHMKDLKVLYEQLQDAKRVEADNARRQQEQVRLNEAKQALWHGEKVDAKFLEPLCAEYGITIPLRTLGWARKSLTMFGDGKYSHYGKPSSKLGEVTRALMEAIKEEFSDEKAEPRVSPAAQLERDLQQMVAEARDAVDANQIDEHRLKVLTTAMRAGVQKLTSMQAKAERVDAARYTVLIGVAINLLPLLSHLPHTAAPRDASADVQAGIDGRTLAYFAADDNPATTAQYVEQTTGDIKEIPLGDFRKTVFRLEDANEVKQSTRLSSYTDLLKVQAGVQQRLGEVARLFRKPSGDEDISQVTSKLQDRIEDAQATIRAGRTNLHRQEVLIEALTTGAQSLQRLLERVPDDARRQYADQIRIAERLVEAMRKLPVDTVRKGAVGMKLKAGEVVLTVTGRPTTPFPKIDVTSNRKAVNTINRVDAWLIDNAVQEANARKDEFNARQFTQAAQQKHPSQSDKDSAEFYLFDDEAYTPPPKPFLKPLV